MNVAGQPDFSAYLDAETVPTFAGSNVVRDLAFRSTPGRLVLPATSRGIGKTT